MTVIKNPRAMHEAFMRLNFTRIEYSQNDTKDTIRSRIQEALAHQTDACQLTDKNSSAKVEPLSLAQLGALSGEASARA